MFLVDKLDTVGEPMTHLKAVVFVRPTGENIALIRRLLKRQRFGEFHLCTCGMNSFLCLRFDVRLTSSPVFTNVVRDSFLHELADADENESIKQIQEHYVRATPDVNLTISLA